jgi:hypothetical protein
MAAVGGVPPLAASPAVAALGVMAAAAEAAERQGSDSQVALAALAGVAL